MIFIGIRNSNINKVIKKLRYMTLLCLLNRTALHSVTGAHPRTLSSTHQGDPHNRMAIQRLHGPLGFGTKRASDILMVKDGLETSIYSFCGRFKYL